MGDDHAGNATRVARRSGRGRPVALRARRRGAYRGACGSGASPTDGPAAPDGAGVFAPGQGARRMSPVARALRAAVLVYRRGISPLLGPRCRFEPTCSAYALEALRVHGAVRGTALTIWRLLRCQPFGTPGYDPVPARRAAGRWRRSRYRGQRAAQLTDADHSSTAQAAERPARGLTQGVHAC